MIEALFEHEYHTLARLKHPRIVEVYEYGLDALGPYYTMELLAGRDLKELAPLPYREACQHLRDVASALALLHAHGLVHRDVSPRNVRLGPDRRVKLIDFGALAPFGVATNVVGTPICIAPELVLGAIAYVTLTGALPLMRGHYAQVLNRVGQHARAKQLLVEALSYTKPEDSVAAGSLLEPRRQLALAEAGLGEHARAVEQLDALLAQHGHEDNRLLVGLLHKARAEVALSMRDEPALHRHFVEMEQRFRATRNPALIAQVEQLASRAQLRQATAQERSSHADQAANLSIQRSFADLQIAPDRYRHALSLVLHRTRAKAGFLYVLRDQRMRLVAENGPSEPPMGLQTELLDTALRLQSDEPREDDADDTRMLVADAPRAGNYQVITLTLYRGRKPIVVGGLILQDSESSLPEATFLESIAQALLERDGLSTAF